MEIRTALNKVREAIMGVCTILPKYSSGSLGDNELWAIYIQAQARSISICGNLLFAVLLG